MKAKRINDSVKIGLNQGYVCMIRHAKSVMTEEVLAKAEDMIATEAGFRSESFVRKIEALNAEIAEDLKESFPQMAEIFGKLNAKKCITQYRISYFSKEIAEMTE